MDLLLRRLYGRSSEKLDPRQGVLFENLSVEEFPPVAPLAEPAPSDRPVDSSPRRGHGRRRTEKNLRHVDIVHDLTDAEKEALGGEVRLVLIGEEIVSFRQACMNRFGGMSILAAFAFGEDGHGWKESSRCAAGVGPGT